MRILRTITLLTSLVFAGISQGGSVSGELSRIEQSLSQRISVCNGNVAAGVTVSAICVVVPIVGWVFAPEMIGQTHRDRLERKRIVRFQRSVHRAQEALQRTTLFAVDPNEKTLKKVAPFLVNFGDVSTIENALLLARKVIDLDASGIGGLFSGISYGDASADFLGEMVQHMKPHFQ